MTEEKQKIQDLLDDFVTRNQSEIEVVEKDNPLLLKSVFDVVDILSKKYGMGKSSLGVAQKIEDEKADKKEGEWEKTKNLVKNIRKEIDEEKKKESTPEEEEEAKGTFSFRILPFDEGDEFIHKSRDDIKYKIAQVDDEDVYVLLPNNKRVHYDTNEAIRLFNEGEWILTSKFNQPKIVDPEKVDEIKQEEAEQVSIDDLKLAIKNLKPLAEFDDEVKQEIERLKQAIKDLKKKKS